FDVSPTAPVCTLYLHDALPISRRAAGSTSTLVSAIGRPPPTPTCVRMRRQIDSNSERDRRDQVDHAHTMARPRAPAVFVPMACLDRKSTRLNSSHVKISYAVFC